MKLAIISDVHSNLPALQAVLAVIDERGADAIYCLGDVVGYGADPAACVDLVRERCAAVVLGNHDVAVARNDGVSRLPRDGQRAARHNREQLNDEQLSFLSGLPLRHDAEDCTFVHATPDEPSAWKRLDRFTVAQDQFDHFDTSVCFLGHTHVPAVMANRLGVLRVRPGARYLINVGSVGQPRDHNPRASFALFDTETFEHETVRVAYDVERAAARIEQAGLSKRLGERLKTGR